MAKNMARLDGDTVINVESWPDHTMETETLKDPGEHPVGIGNTYDNGKWFRDGVEILTPLEELQIANEDMSTALNILLGDE